MSNTFGSSAFEATLPGMGGPRTHADEERDAVVRLVLDHGISSADVAAMARAGIDDLAPFAISESQVRALVSDARRHVSQPDDQSLPRLGVVDEIIEESAALLLRELETLREDGEAADLERVDLEHLRRILSCTNQLLKLTRSAQRRSGAPDADGDEPGEDGDEPGEPVLLSPTVARLAAAHRAETEAAAAASPNGAS